MPFCGECGKKYKDRLKFCPHCGTPNELLTAEKGKQKSESRSQKTEIRKQKSEETTDDYKTQVRGKTASYGVLNLENLPEGHVIDERYEIKAKVGQGGFGAVYRVFDKTMETEKALKIIPEAIVSDKEAMFDLQSEAKTMIALNHPNIVRVYDFHKTGSIKFIDMEYVDGNTLTEIKLEHSNKQIPEAKVKEYAIKIAEGMAYAHDNNVLHKDIKPQNIKITSKGNIKIMDFGIAETVRTSMSRIQNTSSSGTLVYMSPEQIKGKDVGKESDIYSFGAMLYELLSGHPPFYKGDINYQILNEEPEPLKNISPQLNELILKCLAKNYKDRFKNFGEIIKKLGGTSVKYKSIKSKIQARPSKLKSLTMVSIKTEPSEATLLIDNKKYKTPFTNKLSTGLHKLKISKDGYETIEDEITISENSSNDFFIELESILGSVTVESEIDGMRIVMNNKQTEFKTPHTFTNITTNKDYTFSVHSSTHYSDKQVVKLNCSENFKMNIKTLHKLPDDIIFVEGGTFEMGSNDYSDEKPIHSVTLDNFLISKYLITQKEYEEIMGNNPSYFKKTNVIEAGFLGFGRKTESLSLQNNPVEKVIWYDAAEFCNKKSEKEGLQKCYSGSGKNIKCDFSKNGYRLPTEAEWEYAARGGVKTHGRSSQQYAGSNNLDAVAWYYDNSGSKTHAVGQKQPNELGIYDMSGNVWEWCNDWYGKNYYKNSPRNNPLGPSRGKYFVLRGGSWFNYGLNCRVANRNWDYRNDCLNYFGFRIARSVK